VSALEDVALEDEVDDGPTSAVAAESSKSGAAAKRTNFDHKQVASDARMRVLAKTLCTCRRKAARQNAA